MVSLRRIKTKKRNFQLNRETNFRDRETMREREREREREKPKQTLIVRLSKEILFFGSDFLL